MHISSPTQCTIHLLALIVTAIYILEPHDDDDTAVQCEHDNIWSSVDTVVQ